MCNTNQDNNTGALSSGFCNPLICNHTKYPCAKSPTSSAVAQLRKAEGWVQPEQQSSHLSSGAITGIIVGVGVLILCIVIGVVVSQEKQKKAQR
jgi:hypothetical protein